MTLRSLIASHVKQERPEINVKVMSQLDELDQYFRVRCDEPLQQLMIRWSVRANIEDYRTCRFLFDGKRVTDWQTPNEVGMEDGDSIAAFTELMGA
ncbi:putative Ubiquitin-like domain-containing protein [Helianthus anomalus]